MSSHISSLSKHGIVCGKLAEQLLSIVISIINESQHGHEFIQAFLVREELIELEELVYLVTE